MKSCKQLIIFCLFLFLSLTGGSRSHAANQTTIVNQDLPGLKAITQEIKKATQAKNFNNLHSYVQNQSLYWSQCGDYGGENVQQMTFTEMNSLLSKFSKEAQIHFLDPEIHRWDFEKPVFYVVNINTEGWTGEYPFLNFSFKFTTIDNKWRFTGVCESTTSVNTNTSEKYSNGHYKQPSLPRPGARIFKDVYALRARIEEIIRFKAFDALNSYSTKGRLLIAQCSREIMEKDRIIGKEMPAQDVILFLKQNSLPNDKIVSSGVQHKNYYETTGWGGKYPFVAFWFSESMEGWEFAGISYCQKKHLDIMADS